MILPHKGAIAGDAKANCLTQAKTRFGK